MTQWLIAMETMHLSIAVNFYRLSVYWPKHLKCTFAETNCFGKKTLHIKLITYDLYQVKMNLREASYTEANQSSMPTCRVLTYSPVLDAPATDKC